MPAKAEIIEVVGPSEAGIRTPVNIKVTVRNVGDAAGYLGVSSSYLDGTTQRETQFIPTRVLLIPGKTASFNATFSMPQKSIDVYFNVWHSDSQSRVNDDSKKISICVLMSPPTAIPAPRALKKKTVKANSDFLQRQRDILRAFRQATKLRAQAEAEASALQQKRKKQADDELAQIRESASQELDKARKAIKNAQSSLTRVGLETLIEAKKTGLPKVAIEAKKTSQELSTSCTEAVQAGSRLMEAVTEIRNWRGAERERSQINKSLVLLLFACLGLVLFVIGVATQSVGWLLVGLIPPPILLAFADTVWNLGKKEPGDGTFSKGYLWLWLVSPIAPIVALVWIFASYSSSQIAINKRYTPMQPEHTLIPQIRAITPKLVRAVAQVETCHKILVERARQDHARTVKEIETDFQHKTAEIQSAYEKSWQQLQQQNLSLSKDLGLIGAPWKDTLWNSWVTPSGEAVSPYIRIGQLRESGAWHQFDIAALVPVIGAGNIVIKCSGSAKDRAVQLVRCLMLRMLASVPPGKLRFTLIDPVGRGQSIAAFMSLADYDEALVGGKIWTETQHIEEQLTRLTEHMEFVIQKFLRDKYPTIEDYNTEAGEVAEPYRVLVVVNFPINFSESAARRLVSIAHSGPRCGIYTILTIDTEQELPYGFRNEGGNQALKERKGSYKRRMYPAVCASCGKECEVPFQPREGRLVYCTECYAEIKAEGNEDEDNDDEDNDDDSDKYDDDE